MPSHLTGVPADASGLAALMAGLVIILGVAYYAYIALALMTMARKTNTPNRWLAWVPLGNLYLMTQIAKLPWWAVFGFLIVILVVILPLFYILFLAFIIFIWWKACEARGKPGWWGILMIIPLVNLVMMGVVAWTD